MRLRIAVAIGPALFVLAWLPGAAAGHHKHEHADQSARVAGTTELAFVGEHEFVPKSISVRPGGTVEFKNDEFNVAGFGPPHTWTVLASDCDPKATGGCRFDTGVRQPGETAVVDLNGLPPGTYTFICRVGQGGGPFPPHATLGENGWTGMVGTLTVRSTSNSAG